MKKSSKIAIILCTFGLALKVHAEEMSAMTVENSIIVASNDIPALLSAADAEVGKKIASKCIACHSFEKFGPKKVGPNLYGILGARIASIDGFIYSSAIRSKSNDNWSYDNIFLWLNNPKKFIPGNRMAFGGISNSKDIANLVKYLMSQHDNPPPIQ